MIVAGLAVSVALAAGSAVKFRLRVPGVTKFEFPHGSHIELPKARMEAVQKQKEALIDLELAMTGRAAKRLAESSERMDVRFNDAATTANQFETGDGILVRAHRKDSKVFSEGDRLTVDIGLASIVSGWPHESHWEIDLIDRPFIRTTAGRGEDGEIYIELDSPRISPLLRSGAGPQTVVVEGILIRPGAVDRFLVGGVAVDVNRALTEADFRVEAPVTPEVQELVIEARGAEAHTAVIIPLQWSD